MESERERLALVQVGPRGLFLGTLPVGRKRRFAQRRGLAVLHFQNRNENARTRRQRNGLRRANMSVLIDLGFDSPTHTMQSSSTLPRRQRQNLVIVRDGKDPLPSPPRPRGGSKIPGERRDGLRIKKWRGMNSVPARARITELRLHRIRVSQRDIGRSATPWRGCAPVSIRGRRATWGNDGVSLGLPRRGCGLNPKPTVHPTRSRVCERACAVRPGTRTSRDAFLDPRCTFSTRARFEPKPYPRWRATPDPCLARRDRIRIADSYQCAAGSSTRPPMCIM